MSRRLPVLLSGLLLASLALAIIVTPAFGAVTTPTVTLNSASLLSKTAVRWTNVLPPSVVFGPGPGASVSGYYYIADRFDVTTPTLASDFTPQSFPLSQQLLNLPELAKLYPAQPGTTNRAEGVWHVHVRSSFTDTDALSPTGVTTFSVDVTPPNQVVSLTVDATGWTETLRHKISWKDLAFESHGATSVITTGYDQLSGDKSWGLSVNGGTTVTWARATFLPNSLATIETGLRSGINTVSVYCYDFIGNQSAPSDAYLYIDLLAPTVSITAPAPMETVHGLYTLTTNAHDDAGLSSVRFLLDGNTVQNTTSTNMPFQTHNLSDGLHTLLVGATDMFGRTTTSTPVTFNVDNRPMVSITAPPAGGSVSGIYSFSADATDSAGIRSLMFKIDGNVVQGGTSGVMVFETRSLPNGSHSLDVIATDNFGDTATASETFIVNNAAPAVSISAPQPNETIRGLYSFAASATSEVGIRSLTFKIDGNVSQSGTSTVLLYQTHTLTDGTHRLDVTATDNFGAVATATVAFLVNNQPSLTILTPAPNETVRGVYTFSAQATDTAEIRTYAFKIDGAVVQSSAASTMTLQTHTLSDGVHRLDVVATDAFGDAATATLQFSVDNRPVVTILAPQPNETIRGFYTMSVVASDDAGIRSYSFKIDGNVVQTGPSSTLRVLAVLLMEGAHRLDVSATDSFGDVGVAGLTFLVDNHTPPSFVGTPTVTMGLPGGVSADIEDPNYIWFTNNPFPQMAFSTDSTAPELAPIPVYSYYYVVDRSTGTIPDTRSDFTPGTGPFTQQTLDMPGIARTYPSPRLSGETTAVEGDDWHIHVRSFVATTGISTVTAHGHFGIDMTPPTPVQGLTVDASGWTSVYRHRLAWIDKAYQLNGPGAILYPFVKGYDALSGDHQWVVTVNGTATTWDRSAWTATATVQVENGLKEGDNTVSVQVRDWAGNLSAPVTKHIYIDSTGPRVSISAPAQNQWVKGTAKFSTLASDAAGVRSVTFKVDGRTYQVSTSRALSLDTRKLGGGRHVLTVVVKDMIGNTATATRLFNVDNVAPRVSAVSAGPNPFYPCKKDGYKDTSTIRFNVGEPASDVRLYIYQGTRLVIGYTARNTGAGTFWVTWNGRDGSGALPFESYTGEVPAQSVTCTYRVMAKDRAGNVTWSPPRPITIKNYEIVGNGTSVVKIISR